MATTTTSHGHVSQDLMHLLEQILTEDWSATNADKLTSYLCQLRKIKAAYILTHLAHHIPLQEEVIGPLDQALITAYLTKDLLNGEERSSRQTFYHTLQGIQFPLIQTCAMLPQETESHSTSEPSSLSRGIVAEVIEREERKKGPFLWSPEMTQTFVAAMKKYEYLKQKEAIAAIAQEHGWPLDKVTNKYVNTRRPRLQRQQQEESHSDLEED